MFIPKKHTTALVLAGGNLKGAWQAGAIARVLEEWQPDIITGISVGALNAGMLAHYTGQGLGQPDSGSSWRAAGYALRTFWQQKVRTPSQFVAKRSGFDLGLRLLANRWAGLLDTSGLERTVQENVDKWCVALCPARVFVGAVSLQRGSVYYADIKATDLPHDWIMASTAIPVTMSPVRIFGEDWVDGGLRDIAPLRKAITEGATQIIVIATSPSSMDARGKEWQGGSLLGQAGRVLEIVSHELLRSDLERAESINQEIVKGLGDDDHRYLELLVIRPKATLQVSSVEKFTAADISTMLFDGYSEADALMDYFFAGTGVSS